MEWCSASEAASYGAWRPPTGVAEPSASSSRLGTDLPPFIPSESDLNVLISAVESVASFHYDDRAPPLLSPMTTPAQCFAAPVASSAQAPPLYWDGAQFTAVGMCDDLEMPMMHAEHAALHTDSQTNVLASTSPHRATIAPTGPKDKKRAPPSPSEPFATPKSRGGRQCRVPDCAKAVQSRGRCVRHGGGKRCPVEGCSRGAQANGKCKAHGGGVRCTVEGCGKTTQGGGRCRRHGGGKLCEFPGCTKGAQRKGKCAGHKGVRVCSAIGCARPAQERDSFCNNHGGQLKVHL